MTEYDNKNRGVMFVNDRREPGSNKPDRTGTLNVEGVEYFLDGWIKSAKNGSKFLSVSIKRKEVQPQPAPVQPAPVQQATPPRQFEPLSGFHDMNDEPF